MSNHKRRQPKNRTIQQRSLPALRPKEYQTQIVPLINSLLGVFSQYASVDDPVDYRELKQMLATSPVVAVAIETRILLSLSALGQYKNSDKKLQDFVLANEANVARGFRPAIAKALTKYIVGYSFTEIIRQPVAGQWMLSELIYSDPSLASFKGSQGRVTELEVSTLFGYRHVPLNKGLHLTNQDYLNITNSPLGLSTFNRIRPYWKALQVFMSALLIAAPKQAFPFLVGQTDTEREVIKYDLEGQPISGSDGQYVTESAAYQLANTMRDIQNQSAVVVGVNDKITAIAQQSDGRALFTGINLLMKQILLALLIPSVPLIQSEGSGSGDSNLAKVQFDFMENITAIDMHDVAGTIIDQVHKQNIIDNFGAQQDYGHYTINSKFSENQKLVLDLVGDLTQKGALTFPGVELQKEILQRLDLPSEGVVGTLLQSA